MPIRNINNLSVAGLPATLSGVTEKQVVSNQDKADTLPEQKHQESVLPDVLEQAIEKANEVLKHVRPDIKFVLDADSHEVVMMMVEPDTDNVIKRYPSEQALVISHAIVESQEGETVNQQGVLRSAGDGLLGILMAQRT